MRRKWKMIEVKNETIRIRGNSNLTTNESTALKFLYTVLCANGMFSVSIIIFL